MVTGNILVKFLGYGSGILQCYLNSQQYKISLLENEAYDKGKRIYNQVNSSLASRLLGLNTDVLLARL